MDIVVGLGVGGNVVGFAVGATVGGQLGILLSVINIPITNINTSAITALRRYFSYHVFNSFDSKGCLSIEHIGETTRNVAIDFIICQYGVIFSVSFFIKVVCGV